MDGVFSGCKLTNISSAKATPLPFAVLLFTPLSLGSRKGFRDCMLTGGKLGEVALPGAGEVARLRKGFLELKLSDRPLGEREALRSVCEQEKMVSRVAIGAQ